MAINKKISQLPARTDLTGNEEIPFSENGQNGKVKSSILKGQNGKDGVDGKDGAPGTDGVDGKSAYQYATESGYEGTEEEFAQSLAGMQDLQSDVQELQDDVETLQVDMKEAKGGIDSIGKRVDTLEIASEIVSRDAFVAGYDEDDLNPEPKITYGNRDFLIDWDFLLLDTTDNDKTYTTPVGTLKRGNLLRFEDGSFAPVVGITEAMRAECGVELYLDDAGTQKYCDAGGFDAEAFYSEYGMSTKLYDAAGQEVRILRPWETVENKYTIGVAHKKDLYLLDGVQGESGTVWKGVFTFPVVWDGIDVTPYKLVRTAIAPCPVCTVGGKTRSFFYLYAGENNCKSSKGEAGLCTMFDNGRTYPRCVDMQQVTNMNYARANNADNTKPYPFAEGGYHALNTYITCMELYYGTKYLHDPNKFGSGISSNDGCSNENAFLKNGGVRYRVNGTDAWTYNAYNATPNICVNANNQKTNFSALLNLEYPKEQCMESQMAASFASETGVSENVPFEFYGGIYRYVNVHGAYGINGGGMNARVYKAMSQTINAYNTGGSPVQYDIEVNLRMSLFGGVGLSGDIFAYWGGGAGIVSTCVDTSSHVGHPTKLYLECDQQKWMRETAFEKGNLGVFDFESHYMLVGDGVSLGDSYVLKRYNFSPYKKKNGGGIAQGECAYCWDNRYWSSVMNQRVVRALRFRGYAANGACSPRLLTANSAASSAYRHYCGSAQAVIGFTGGAAEPQAQ